MTFLSGRARAPIRALSIVALAGLLLAPGVALAKKAPAQVAPPPGTPERNGAVLVTVNGQAITQGMMDTALTVLPEEVRVQVLEGGMLGQLQEKLVLQELLWQEAIARGLPDDPATRAKMVMAMRDVLATAVLEAESKQRSDDAAVKAYYDGHPELFQSPQVQARHILVKDEAVAKDLLTKIQGGTDFGQLARAHSVDPGSGPNGGDLGWFGKGQMVPEFEAAAFGAVQGSTVGPVKTQYGWHLIQVTGARSDLPFDEVKEELKARLQDESSRTFLQELREKASIVPAAGGSAAPAPK